MGAVFDGQTKVGRAVADPGSDNVLPNPGSLMFAAISTPVAVTGTVGALATLVHGDRWEQLDGSLMEITNTNVTTMIMGNETQQVTGNRTLTTTGNVTETIVGMLNETLIAGENSMCVGPYNRTDVAPVTWLCPTSSQINSGDLYECKIFKGGCYALRNTNVGVDFSLRITNTQFHIHQLGVAQFETKLDTVEGFAALTTNKVNGLRNFVDGLRNNMSGMTSRLRALDAGVGAEVSPPLELGTPPFD